MDLPLTNRFLAYESADAKEGVWFENEGNGESPGSTSDLIHNWLFFPQHYKGLLYAGRVGLLFVRRPANNMVSGFDPTPCS